MSWLTRHAARLLGSAVAAGLLLSAASPAAAQGRNAIRDTEIETIIHEWADPVFAGMGLVPSEIEILLIAEQDLNAFATRGRIMGLNTGLIQAACTPNELLGVIAHEAGHIKHRHTLRDGAQDAGMQPMLMTMALGALAIAAGAPDAGAVLLGNSQYFGTLSALQYMQAQESQADIAGAQALQAAGLSGRGLVSFFENFRSQEVFSDARRYPYFRSHPISSNRIATLRRLVEEQPGYGRGDTPEQLAQHLLVVAKIHAFMDDPRETLREYSETPSTLSDPTMGLPPRCQRIYANVDKVLPARYARAIAWYRDGQTDRALSAVDGLLAEQPDNPYFWELKGQILFEEGRAEDSIEAHQRSVDILPNAPLLRVNLGHALIETRDPARLATAVDHLKRATALEKDNSMAWRLLAQAYDSQGKEGEARLASAEMYFAAGAEQQATQFALRARDMLDPGSAEWTRAMDIVFASGATQRDVDDLDRRNESRRPGVIPAGG